MEKDVMWKPSEARRKRANLTKYMAFLRQNGVGNFASYDDLYEWSIERSEVFWETVAEFLGIRFSKKATQIYQPAKRFQDSVWFSGAELNYAEHLLQRRDAAVALLFRNEKGDRREVRFKDLHRMVEEFAGYLRSEGIEKGDRIVGFMPNIPETVVAMLATASIGAIWSSCSPDFGVKGVLDRFGQIKPRVLITADGYHYGGKRFDSLERVRQLLVDLPSVERVVVVPYTDADVDLSGIRNVVLWKEARGSAALEFEQVDFNHPFVIMYSSGTTGLPKSIVHGTGGTLLQHLKELVLHTDIKSDDRVFYYTTCGWMMWNWLISSLAVGATVVLYDGSPISPEVDSLWKMAAEEAITVFGTSAKYLAAQEKAGVRPLDLDLRELRTILSTGSPLAPEQFDYVYENVKRSLQLSSISGGTDIVSCFALGNPLGVVVRGELQVCGLGMAVDVFDENGQSVRNQRGELVCRTSFPSKPVFFWDDSTGERYHRAYFERFENVWNHGDYAEIRSSGGVVIYGRSDAVLNPGGVRIGTAEIYRVVEGMDEVLEAVVVGQDWDEDVRIVLFVRLAENNTLDEKLKQKIRKRIREEETPRHVPSVIAEVADIPRTISGKITEIAVREVIHGREVKNRDALKNPEALEHFRDRVELRM